MELFSVWLVLLIAWICGVIAQDALPPASPDPNEDDHALEPLDNRSGWVNPEDFAPMPQCIAQQDQSAWLSAMTRCTGKKCTRHFGVICTHHQWLTQLSCLSQEMSPALVQSYFPYCSRSVLAKAQLYRWIHAVTSRTWLVNVGDARGLEWLSPASLTKGYADLDVANKAPTCLTESTSASSMESFQFVMASCGFTATTQHMGNAARPWEYSESLHSIIALDFETASYDDIPWHWIGYGDYFDKQCFCKVFTTDPGQESCSATGLALTRERMWMYATCGPDSLPGNWTDGLKTTVFDYIPTDTWRWPLCVNDVPEKVIGLTGQCATDACDTDSDGYCKITSAVDRACFCHNISYDTCKGACQEFETRIDYVNWLHDLCGRVDGWDGLPENWWKLAAPTPLDMIPWRWNLTNSGNSTQGCTSSEWKIAGLVMINMATLLAGVFGGRTETTRNHLPLSYPSSWFKMGIAITAIHLLANWINAMLIQSTPGYEDIPLLQLTLLWCALPRATWLTILLSVMQPSERTTIPTILACLFAETILQILSISPILTTITYGWQHAFYAHSMAKINSMPAAQIMYAGALLWLIIVIIALVLALQAISNASAPSTINDKNRPSNIAEELVAPFNERWTWLEENVARYWVQYTCDTEETPLLSRSVTVYGTHPVRMLDVRFVRKSIVRLVLIAMACLSALCVAQWMFWVGLIAVGEHVFCPTRLGMLGVVWIVAAVGAGVVR